MRQVFTSPRLDNVEAVAKLLGDEGIEIKTSEGRGYKQFSRREFSYVEKNASATQAAVWVIKPADYKRARELLHDIGLIDATPAPAYVPAPLQFSQAPAASRMGRVTRLRMVLIFLVGAVGVGLLVRSMFAS